MTLSEKKRKFKRFITTEYSDATFHYLNIFKSCCLYCLRIIEINGVAITKLEKGEISHNFDDDTLLGIKHMILLDALSKLMMLMEGFFVFNYCLLNNLKKLPLKMVTYQPREAYTFIKKIESKNIQWDDIWKIFAYPKLENLSLTVKEKAAVKRVLKSSSKCILSNYMDLINFYKNHSIIYNKFKHGFSLIPGMKEVNSDDSFTMALDRKEEKHRVKGKFFHSSMLYYGFYNAFSILPFKQETFKNLSKYLANLQNLIENIVENHNLRAFNCDIDYMPKSLIIDANFPKQKYRNFQNIMDKKLSSSIDMSRIGKSAINITARKEFKEKMEKMFEENHVATFWTNPLRKRFSKEKIHFSVQ